MINFLILFKYLRLINYLNMENDETKKLLNDLLQKLLDRRLYKLEKKNKEEESTLYAINKESQKALLTIDECSHRVRKQIYLIRNKYVDDNRSRNSIKNEITKTIEKNKTINNNNVNNINTNLFINTIPDSNSNLKKFELYQHDKEEKMRNKKKRQVTLSPRSVKNMLLEEKMKTIQKSIKDLKAKFKSTKNIKKFQTQKNYLTVETTPKKKSKIKPIYTNSKRKINKKSPGKMGKTLTNYRINTHKNENIENKQKEDLHELSINVNEKDEDLRLAELKLDDNKNNQSINEKKPSNDKSEERKKSPIKEQQNIKEESLLVNNLSNLNNGIIDNNKNLTKEENEVKKTNEEENKIIQNNNIINNEKELKDNIVNDNIEKNNPHIVNKNNLDNIILSDDKKKNIDHLMGDSSINFTLIQPEAKDEENDENNKTIDLNISGLSDQLTIEEKFQSHLDDILIYLDNKDICNLLLINKECFKSIMNFLISKTEIKIDIFEEEISSVIEENKNILNIDINNIKIKKFEFNANSSRAISLLNTVTENNFLKIKNEFLKNKEINIIFSIFFIAEGKNEIINMDNTEQKWEYIFNFFKKHIEKQAMGNFIESELNGKIFEVSVINSLYKYAYKYSNIISPNHFQKINKDIAILVFIIKDMLEHLGILTDTKLSPEKEISLIKSRLDSNKEILEKLNEINNKIN